MSQSKFGCRVLASDIILGDKGATFVDQIILQQGNHYRNPRLNIPLSPHFITYIQSCLIMPFLAQCNQPSSDCGQALYDLERWEYSVEGSSCLAMLADINANSTLQVRDKANDLCTGRCGAGFDFYMRRLESYGCNRWAAYNRRKVLYATACYKATKTSIDYCSASYSLLRVQRHIDIALNTSGKSLVDRNAALEKVCTKCFYEYIRIATSYSTQHTTTALRKLGIINSCLPPPPGPVYIFSPCFILCCLFQTNSYRTDCCSHRTDCCSLPA